MDNLVTIDELAEILKVQKSWLYSRTRQRGADSIPTLRIGKYLRFRVEEVLDWLDKYLGPVTSS